MKKKRPKGLTEHHRKPQSVGGSNDPRNISYISDAKHQAWHILFANLEAKDIATLINTVYLDPDYEFVVARRHYALNEEALQRHRETGGGIVS